MVVHQRQRYFLGLAVLLLVVFIWVGSSFLMNYMFANRDYNKPFAITYLNQASLSLYLLNLLFTKKRSADKQRIIDFNHSLYDTLSRSSSETDSSIRSERSNNENDASRQFLASEPQNQRFIYQSPPASTTALVNDETTFFMRSNVGLSHGSSDAYNYLDPHDVLSSVYDDANKLKIGEVAKLALIFCVLWFAANWSNNASLAYTNVASSTILSSMSGLFTLILGALVGTERFTLSKLAAVCISLVGIILISSNSSEMPTNNPHAPSAPLFGDFLALIGAFFYGCNIVLLKFRIQDESRIDMSMFFGFVGVFNVLLLWPVFWILDLTGIENFQLPPDSTVWTIVAINALIGTFLSDYLWLLATFMTSPLVVTLGLSLTIPLALLGDVMYKHLSLGVPYWIGAIFVLAGFYCCVQETETAPKAS